MASQYSGAVHTLAIGRGERAVGVDVLPGDISRGAGVGVDIGIVAEGGDVCTHIL